MKRNLFESSHLSHSSCLLKIVENKGASTTINFYIIFLLPALQPCFFVRRTDIFSEMWISKQNPSFSDGQHIIGYYTVAFFTVGFPLSAYAGTESNSRQRRVGRFLA